VAALNARQVNIMTSYYSSLPVRTERWPGQSGHGHSAIEQSSYKQYGWRGNLAHPVSQRGGHGSVFKPHEVHDV
jgi:hypothetical protein